MSKRTIHPSSPKDIPEEGNHHVERELIILTKVSQNLLETSGSFFCYVTTDIRHHSAETILCISKRFFATCSQLNFWYWKLLVFFQVNQFTGNWCFKPKFRGSNLSRPNFFVYFYRIVCIYDTNRSLCGNGLLETVKKQTVF